MSGVQTEIDFCNCKLDFANMVMLATASMSAHDASRCGALRSKQLNFFRIKWDTSVFREDR